MGSLRSTPSCSASVSRSPRALVALGLALLVGLASPACRGDTHTLPATPSPVVPSLSGTWTGTISEPSGTARLVVVLDERETPGLGSVLSGTWSLEFPDPARNDAGTLSGSRREGEAAIDLRPHRFQACPPVPPPFDPPPAGSRWLQLWTSPRLLTGSSLYVTCIPANPGVPGHVELSR